MYNLIMLRFEKILPKVEQIVKEKSASVKLKEEIIEEAINILEDIAPHDFDGINFANFPYFIADPVEKPTAKIKTDTHIEEYIAIATDGSEIPIDTDFIVPYYVINTGTVVIGYLKKPKKSFFHVSSIPEIYYKDDELYETIDGKKFLVKGELLESKMLLEESIQLERAVNKYIDSHLPIVSLIDGTLIQWEIKNRSDQFKEAFIKKFEHLILRNKEKNIPVAGYVSGSHSKDVIGLIKMAAIIKLKQSENDVKKFDMIQDTDIFERLLNEGERSALFKSNVPILKLYREPIYFFYMNTGMETARIEIPGFVKNNEKMLNLLHFLVLDQAKKGMGYPVVLKEAHEQAVIRNTDKFALNRFFIEYFVKRGIRVKENYKSMFKKTKGI